jgi:hypothetical protein
VSKFLVCTAVLHACSFRFWNDMALLLAHPHALCVVVVGEKDAEAIGYGVISLCERAAFCFEN